MLDLADIFGHGGPLERALPAFKVRRQQLRMAERVASAIEGRETLAVEAGTGTGKTSHISYPRSFRARAF